MIIIVKPVAQVTHSGLEATGAQASFHHFSGFQPIIYKLHLEAPPKAIRRNRSLVTGNL